MSFSKFTDTFEPAYILHSRHYRDTHKIIDCFTEKSGRLTLIAKKARCKNSPWRYLLQPFSPLNLYWQSGRGDMMTLLDAEPLEPPFILSGNRLLSGLYINELLIRLYPRHDPAIDFFYHYCDLLSSLAKDTLFEAALRAFEKQLLAVIGFGLSLDCELNTGEKIMPMKYYHFHLEQGPILTDLPACDQVGRDIYSGKSLLAIHDNNFSEVQVLRDAKRLMRQIFHQLLEGKPLKVRELYQHLS